MTLEERILKLRRALEFYADKETYDKCIGVKTEQVDVAGVRYNFACVQTRIIVDQGSHARNTLNNDAHERCVEAAKPPPAE